MTRISILSVAVLAILAVLPGSAQANFQYIPDGGNGATAPVQAPNGSAPMDTPPAISRQSLMKAPSSSKTSSGNMAVISGFGKKVPLVIALREIVPASYQFAYADGISLGTLVDWKGGKPWTDVMADVVTPLGLTATEKNMVIYVEKQK